MIIGRQVRVDRKIDNTRVYICVLNLCTRLFNDRIAVPAFDITKLDVDETVLEKAISASLKIITASSNVSCLA